MFTEYTFQDWLAAPNKEAMMRTVVDAFKASHDFKFGLEANEYKAGRNPTVMKKVILKAKALVTQSGDLTTANEEIIGNRISSNFFARFVTQQNQYLLGYGVTLKDDKEKEKLGAKFDTALQRCGEMALTQGVSYGFWNNGELQPIESATNLLSGFAPLLDEMSGALMAGIQFWQLRETKPMYYRLYEVDGVTEYKQTAGVVIETMPKTAYVVTTQTDAIGTRVIDGKNYKALPVVPFYANTDYESELRANIKSKIDSYDTISSDFADNLDRANEVYWALKNFNGTPQEIETMLGILNKLKVAMTDSDNNASSAEPHTIEVPYAARKEALDLLSKALYQDYMALDMTEITAGSLTNVAIKAATKNLDLKADQYEYQALDFVQQILALAGVDASVITFQRNTIENEKETADIDYLRVQTVQAMRADLSLKYALGLYPYIDPNDIDQIIKDKDAEDVSGQPSVEDLQAQIDEQNQRIEQQPAEEV